MTKTFRLYNYDLWGNAQDGFEVNDVTSTGLLFEIPTEASNAEVLRIVFGDDADGFEVNQNYSCEEAIYIDDVDESAPYCELRAE
jgi:hypothetical protein